MTSFSNTYQEARNRFIQAAKAQNLDVESFSNPEKGPDKKPLYTDIAWYGPRQASRLVIINSATHGAEGFCGSGCQIFTLEKDLQQFLPPDTALLFIHALNPYGFAWLRRANEDNIDLNRNFVDHHQPYPVNTLYEKFHPFFCLEDWNPTTQPQTDKLLVDCCEQHGSETVEAALCLGQYTRPDGLMFGGHKVTWSNRTLHEILANYANQAEKVAFIDIHTGLGPRGHGAIFSLCKEEDPAFKRAQQWLGDDVISPYSGETIQPVKVPMVTGDVVGAVQRALSKAEVTAFVIEYGTYPFLHMLQGLCAENWFHFKGNLHTPEGERIKAQFKENSYPNDSVWKQMILDRYNDILLQTLEGVTTPSATSSQQHNVA